MKENNFRIIVPVYNSEQWISKCILSISNQKYKNWTCVIINDASSDGTLNIIKRTLEKNINKEHFKVFSRNWNVGALENIVYGTYKICLDDEDIIIVVDGDDWLIDENVLSYLNEVYQDDNIWLTYGNYINASSGKLGYINKQLMNTRNYRNSQDFTTSHLRTYKFKIWKRIQDADLRDSYGKYYKITGDLAIMFPLIEMSGLHRIKFIEKALYVYNDLNPINDHKKNPSLQIKTNLEIRNKLKYKEL
jgi:glycosyltransferase involved in cell wall biosynthesis